MSEQNPADASRRARLHPRQRVAAIAWSARLGDAALALAVGARGVTVGLADGSIEHRDPGTGILIDRIAAHRGPVAALASHRRDPCVASAGHDGAVLLHRAGGSIAVEPAGAVPARTVAWSGGGRLAASVGRVASVYTADGRRVLRCAAVERDIGEVAWSPDGRQLAVACAVGVRVFHVFAGQRSARLDGTTSLTGVAWSGDGRFLASASDGGHVDVWRMPTGMHARLPVHSERRSVLAWSPGGAWLAVSGAPQIEVWKFDQDLAPEDPVVLDRHPKVPSALAFSPGGATLASGCRAGLLALWSLRWPPLLRSTFELGHRIDAITWSARDRMIAIAGNRLVAIDVHRA